MRYFWVLVIFTVACDRATAPRPFTLGPGCVTREATPIFDNVTGKRIGTLIVDSHWPACPDPLPLGHTLLHWDTTWVSH